MRPDLSVVIVNYNGKKYLKDCLESLKSMSDGMATEVIIVDNDSKDGSADFITEHFPEVKLIRSKANLGFGKGNNEGAKHAAGDFLLLLNNDTILLDPIKPALDYLKSHPKVGVVGINMRDANGGYLNACGNFPNAENMFRLKNLSDVGPGFTAGNFSDTAYEVDWLGGAFMMIPSKVYREVGGFDESFFMYVEDVDLCRKIADKGYRRIFLPDMRYIHFVGFSPERNPLLIAGYEIYINKHFSGIQRSLLLLLLNVNKTIKILKKELRIS